MELLKKKNILITGGAGQLARALEVFCSSVGIRSVNLTHAQCDIADLVRIRSAVDKYRPDIIFNGAAYNLVDDAQQNPSVAFAVNQDGPANLAMVARRKGIFFVHFSTDHVFSGEKGAPYVEEDAPAPISIYGQSKLAGEREVIASGADHLLFRVSWLFGDGTQNFLFKLRHWLATRDQVAVSTDEISIPTYAEDAASLSMQALSKGLRGLYHLTSCGYCSRYDWARFFCREMGIDRKIATAVMAQFDLPAKRPSFSAMSNAALAQALGQAMPTWEDAVSRFCRKIRS